MVPGCGSAGLVRMCGVTWSLCNSRVGIGDQVLATPFTDPTPLKTKSVGYAGHVLNIANAALQQLSTVGGRLLHQAHSSRLSTHWFVVIPCPLPL